MEIVQISEGVVSVTWNCEHKWEEKIELLDNYELKQIGFDREQLKKIMEKLHEHGIIE